MMMRDQPQGSGSARAANIVETKMSRPSKSRSKAQSKIIDSKVLHEWKKVVAGHARLSGELTPKCPQALSQSAPPSHTDQPATEVLIGLLTDC